MNRKYLNSWGHRVNLFRVRKPRVGLVIWDCLEGFMVLLVKQNFHRDKKLSKF